MTIPEPWEPAERAGQQYCPACQQPVLQCACHRPAPAKPSAADERKLCPIWDCHCPAGAQLREAWTNMNRILDQYGNSPEYQQAWGPIERYQAQRQATCHCPTT